MATDPAVQRVELPAEVGMEILKDRGEGTYGYLTALIAQYLRGVVDIKRHHADGLPPVWRKWRYITVEELVLDKGHPTGGKITDCKFPQMRAGNCFENAFRLALADPDLRYYEGWACMEGSIPAHHAWVVDGDGVTHDPTWLSIVNDPRNAAKLAEKDSQTRCVWVGIHIPIDTHIAWFLEHNSMNLLSIGEMTPPGVLERGMDYYAEFTPDSPVPADASAHVRATVLGALDDAGQWVCDEETGIFTHDKTGQRWCGHRKTYI